jgi:hypothetical protein
MGVVEIRPSGHEDLPVREQGRGLAFAWGSSAQAPSASASARRRKDLMAVLLTGPFGSMVWTNPTWPTAIAGRGDGSGDYLQRDEAVAVGAEELDDRWQGRDGGRVAWTGIVHQEDRVEQGAALLSQPDDALHPVRRP